MVKILDERNSVLNKFIAQIRDINIQKDSMRFRRNLERVGEIMAYEISKTISYSPKRVETQLGEAEINLSDENIVIASVLRSGVPFHQGFLNYFDDAQSSFISAFRKYRKNGKFDIKIEYISTCDLRGKTLILVDPSLATGASLVLAYKDLIEKGGVPAHTHIAAVIASEEGVEYVKRHLSQTDVTIWCGSLDAEMTSKAYIVPGLGDAGDLAYGPKVDNRIEDDHENIF